MAIENNSLASEAAAATSEASSGGGGAEETAAAAVTTSSSTKTPAGVATLGKQIEEMRNKSLAKGDTWWAYFTYNSYCTSLCVLGRRNFLEFLDPLFFING